MLLKNSFFKYNISAILSSSTDTLVFVILDYGLHVPYIYAAIISAISGAFVAFFLGRNWTFMKKDGAIKKQAIRFVMVSGLSLVLNTLGLVPFIEIFHFEDWVAKIVVAILVGIFVNYPLFKYFVYK